MSLGILDGIVQTFELATQTWFSTLFPIAQNLFFALMVIQIVLGMMNLLVMAGIAAVIAIEKLLPKGQAAAKAVGVLAVVAGIACLVSGRLRI